MSESDSPDQSVEDERRALLARRTEAGRLERGAKLADKVSTLVADADLVIAAVAKYNVVIDAGAKRIQHACRDFQGQFRDGRLCKHVAAVFFALDAELALPMLRQLAADESGWSLEVISSWTPGR